MKRDFDIIRKILLSIESAEPGNEGNSLDLLVNKHTSDKINYHLTLLIEAGYIDAFDTSGMSENYGSYIVNRLTWEGHEFLDASRDNKVWENTKKVLQPVTSVSMDVLKLILFQSAKELLGLS